MAGLLIALGVAWWFARDTSSRPDPSRSDGSISEVTAAPKKAEPRSADARRSDEASQPKPLYRWTDAAGVVHFTDVPPPDRPYVEVDVNPDRNVIRLPSPVEP